MSGVADELREAAVQRPEEGRIVRRGKQSAGARMVDKCGGRRTIEAQRRRHVVRPEFGAERTQQQGVQHGFVDAHESLDQRDPRRLSRGRFRRFPVRGVGRLDGRIQQERQPSRRRHQRTAQFGRGHRPHGLRRRANEVPAGQRAEHDRGLSLAMAVVSSVNAA